MSLCSLLSAAQGPSPPHGGLLTYEGTANLPQGACPVHFYFCRCSAQAPLLPPQLQPHPRASPPPGPLAITPCPSAQGTSGSASSLDAIPLLEHDIVLEGAAHVHVNIFDVPRVEPGLLLHSLWVESRVGDSEVKSLKLTNCHSRAGAAGSTQVFSGEIFLLPVSEAR